jgi:hypothetical protein
MDSIAEANGVVPHDLAPVAAPEWLAVQMASGLSGYCARTFGAPLPDSAMPGVITHLRGIVANLSQGAAVDAEWAAWLELVRRGQGWREVEAPAGAGVEGRGLGVAGARPRRPAVVLDDMVIEPLAGDPIPAFGGEPS